MPGGVVQGGGGGGQGSLGDRGKYLFQSWLPDLV